MGTWSRQMTDRGLRLTNRYYIIICTVHQYFKYLATLLLSWTKTRKVNRWEIVWKLSSDSAKIVIFSSKFCLDRGYYGLWPHFRGRSKMSIWDSISNWTSSISSSIFLEERLQSSSTSSEAVDIFTELFNWNNFSAVDSFWSVLASVNSSIADTVSNSNELFLVLYTFANLVFTEVIINN